MNLPTSPPLHSKEEKGSNSPACFGDTHDKRPHVDEQESKGKEGDMACRARGEMIQSWEQPPWIVKDTIPNFIRPQRNCFALNCYSESDRTRSTWIPVPTNFHDLVQIFKDYGVMPMFHKIPHIMGVPEFAGYPWMHRRQEWFDAEFFRRTMWEDQRIFHRIVFASCQTGRAPLCAPDYFYLPSEQRKLELRYLFQTRNQIPGIEWNSSIETKKPEEHIDYRPFYEYIRGHLPTAEFLFELPKVWKETWFARTISETAEKVPTRAEIVHLVKAAGYEITEKNGWFGKLPWSLADEEVIKRVAFARWIEWGKRSEQDLERLGSHLIEL